MSAEIRSRIFKLAIDDLLCISDADPVRLYQHLGRQIGKRHWFKLRRCYLGLTQTCRQLREEFLPLHQTRVLVAIFLDDLSDYIETLFRSGKVADIQVAVRYSCTFHEFPSSSNVQNLFLLCAEESAAKICFKPRVYHNFQEMLHNQSKYPRFFEYVRTRVDSAQFLHDSLDHHVRQYFWTRRALEVRLYLTVKQQFGQYWMGRPYLSYCEQKLELWRHELGVEGINIYPNLAGGMIPAF